MSEMLKRISANPHFEVVVFPEETILNEPVSQWPLCDSLICFYATGFPLAKARRMPHAQGRAPNAAW